MRLADRHAIKHLVLMVAVAGVLLPPTGCSKKPAANANKDMQKQQTNLMNAMDKIAADEAKKREAPSPTPSSPDAGAPIPAEKSDAPEPAAPPAQPPAPADKPPTQ